MKSTSNIVLRIIAVIVVIEFLIMVVLRDYLYEFGPTSAAVIDALLLSLVASPIIYYWVIRPYVRAGDQAIADLNRLAQTDSLTGLSNRHFFWQRFGEVMAEIRRHQHIGALIMLDLDRFKRLNDTYGHDAGDAMLRSVARQLREITRGEDTVARLGGDEFMLLVPRLGEDTEQALASVRAITGKLYKAICLPLEYDGNSLEVGVSIGVRLILPADRATMDTLMQEVDQAMYTAKHGDEKIVIHDAGE